MSIDANKWAKWVHKEVRVGKTAKAVLRELADVASADGRAWPLVSSIASVVEVDERTVIRALNKLVEEKLIEHESWITPPNSAKRRPVYRLAMPEASPFSPSKDLKKRGGKQPNAKPKGCQNVTLGEGLLGETVTSKGDRNDTPKGDTVSPKTKNSNCSEAIASSPSGRAPEEIARKIIAAWPVEYQGRTSVREVAAAIRAERQTEPDELEAGCLAYAANRKAWGSSGEPMSPHKLIASGRWETSVRAVTPQGSARARTGFAGPEAFRAAFVANHGAKGEAWAKSYLDPCGWRDADQTLLARTGAAEEWLRGRGYRVERLNTAAGVR